MVLKQAHARTFRLLQRIQGSKALRHSTRPASSKPNPGRFTTEQLAQALQQGDVAELWNVLTEDYFTGAMIPGSSRRMPLDRLGRVVAAAGTARDAAVVTYCSGPACPQSRMAAEKLTALGFTNVRAHECGLQAWAESGRRTAPLLAERAA